MVCWKRHSGVALIVLSGLGAFACSQPEQTFPATTATSGSAPRVEADKPFAPGGRITLQLAGGSYDVRAAAEGRIRVTLTGNTPARFGDARATAVVLGCVDKYQAMLRQRALALGDRLFATKPRAFQKSVGRWLRQR